MTLGEILTSLYWIPVCGSVEGGTGVLLQRNWGSFMELLLLAAEVTERKMKRQRKSTENFCETFLVLGFCEFVC